MFRKILKPGLSVFLIIFILYSAYELYYLDKVFFFCPVEYSCKNISRRYFNLSRWSADCSDCHPWKY